MNFVEPVLPLTPSLAGALERFRVFEDVDVQDVLRCLEVRSAVSTAFGHMLGTARKPDMRLADKILLACIEALARYRGFQTEVASVKENAAALDEAKAALDEATVALAKTNWRHEREFNGAKKAVDRAKKAVEAERRYADKRLKRLPATQKTGEGAALLAATRHLAHWVKFLTGRPNHASVATLVEALFGVERTADQIGATRQR